MQLRALSVLLLAIPFPAFSQAQPQPATEATKQLNAALLTQLDFADKQDFEDAHRGFIATVPDLSLKNSEGLVVYALQGYAFLNSETAPDTVNPSLWRQARLNMANGLFKVTDRVYQIRGFDLSNMTIIEGDTGLIVIDPLMSPETAKAGLDLYHENRPKMPVVAVIYTHSHIDHYGGVKGVTTQADVEAGKVQIIAPNEFLEEAVSENVYAGTAMGRRGLYHTGALLPKNPNGQVDVGLGKNASLGASTLIAPTKMIKHTSEKETVDGVEMNFQLAPNTEAPAEMLIYFPQFKLLDAAEDANHTLHNLYTLRGAQVRDAKSWWKTLNLAIDRYGDGTEVIIGQHHWPIWGNQRILTFLKDQRDMYKYIHDQTLHLANNGETPVQIAEELRLPLSLANKWYDRGYYGSLNHDVKAVYQRYLGWYDGNPAHLYEHPPTEDAKRYVEYMGGPQAVIEKARKDYAKGDYRWVAEVLDRVVFADPSNKAARELEADALEQLGYQAENGTWRNNFLQGAAELRNGVPKIHLAGVTTPDVVQAMTSDMLLDYMGIRLNSSKAAGKSLRITWVQPDTRETYALEMENSVLVYTPNKSPAESQATLNMKRSDLANALMGRSSLDAEISSGRARITGDQNQVTSLFAALDSFSLMFPIVEP